MTEVPGFTDTKVVIPVGVLLLSSCVYFDHVPDIKFWTYYFPAMALLSIATWKGIWMILGRRPEMTRWRLLKMLALFFTVERLNLLVDIKTTDRKNLIASACLLAWQIMFIAASQLN